MAKDKQFEPLKGSEGYDVWTSRMENLAKRKGLGALMHFGNDYANAICDGDVDWFNGTYRCLRVGTSIEIFNTG